MNIIYQNIKDDLSCLASFLKYKIKKMLDMFKTCDFKNFNFMESFKSQNKDAVKFLSPKYLIILAGGASLLLIITLAGLSGQTKQFSLYDIGVNVNSVVSSENANIPSDIVQEGTVKKEVNGIPSGVAFVSMNIELVNKELNSGAGWVVNDLILPTQFLDNKSNFQNGVREIYLRSIQILRENLSRQDRTNSVIDEDINKAYGYISVRPESWIFPSYEGQLKKSTKSLSVYKDNLINGKSGFYPRADTLVKILEIYSSLLGSVSTKLNKEDVTWFNQDDRFYYAKGVSYGMYENLLAINHDFKRTLIENNGDQIMESIIKELRLSYFEPSIVLSADRVSWRNNHLDRMSRFLLSVRQKMNSLSSVLLHRGSPSGG